ncbi:hypothetical protein Tco_0555403 [Tanacetum coccineum]
MTTLAEHVIVAGADNRPPMLEKSIRWCYKTYEELSDKEKLQDDCDLCAMNIVLQGISLDIYALVNHNQQLQVNTKFLNGLQPEWSKFVTNVKLAKSMYTTNYDQLYAYLSQHEGHANEVRLMRERYPDLLALVATHHHISSYPNNNSQYNTS